MKIFDLFIEPANYTLDAIRNVHSKIGVDYTFIFDSSSASAEVHLDVPVLSRMTSAQLFRYVWQTLKGYDAFIINGYTNRFCLTFILLDILFFQKPYAIDSDTELRIPKNPLKGIVKRLFLKLVFGRAYAYGFAGGYHSHTDLFTYYGMARERVLVNGMVIDNALYAREGVPEPGKVFRFGFIGRLIPLKQVDKIIIAFKELSKITPCELVIIGDGDERSRLEAMSRDSNNIRFEGALFGDTKIQALHKMNALILYSTAEQWGLVLNEALASGIPCIVSDKVGAHNDLILGDNPTGLVVPYNNVNKLADAMRTLATDGIMWRKFSNAALARMKLWDYEMQREAIRRFVNG